MKRGIVLLVIVILLLISIFYIIPKYTGNFGVEVEESGESESEEKAHDQYIEPSTIPEGTGVTYTASTEEEPATFDISKTTEPLEVKSFEGTVITDQGEVSGTFNNFVIGNGGFYEATITGVAAGTTMYFLSYFDDQIFKFTAGKEETEVRVIQFQTNGSSQERIYIELATGDIIDQGSLFDEQDYHFYAYDDASIYIYNADQTTEIEYGEHSYTGEYTESFEAFEDSITTELYTDGGFQEVTLPSNASYKLKYNPLNLNLTLKNTNGRDITLCKEDNEDCDAITTLNKFTIYGRDKTLKQNDYTIIESYDINNVIELDFNLQTIYLSNTDSTEEILATFKTGYHEIKETQDTILSRILEKEYPYLFRTYDSDNPIPILTIDSTNTLIYEDEKE